MVVGLLASLRESDIDVVWIFPSIILQPAGDIFVRRIPSHAALSGPSRSESAGGCYVCRT